jgi:hypothetical protein
MISNPVPWPDGAKCACAITFDIDTDSILHLEHRERAPTMLSTMSWLKYDEIAIPRILEVYKRAEIKQTFFLSGLVYGEISTSCGDDPGRRP